MKPFLIGLTLLSGLVTTAAQASQCVVQFVNDNRTPIALELFDGTAWTPMPLPAPLPGAWASSQDLDFTAYSQTVKFRVPTMYMPGQFAEVAVPCDGKQRSYFVKFNGYQYQFKGPYDCLWTDNHTCR